MTTRRKILGNIIFKIAVCNASMHIISIINQDTIRFINFKWGNGVGKILMSTLINVSVTFLSQTKKNESCWI